ncbi:hypothetical protein C0992_010196 [Termitomyces sp. T32_za158]|nr:hypothetical protein C0992_010196 [Termitomyces sp. T32_za158]
MQFSGGCRFEPLEVLQQITSTTEVANILAKYPHWDRGPRCLCLPAITKDSQELPNTTDHIKPGSWRGNVSVKFVSLLTSWKRGRRIIEDRFSSLSTTLGEANQCLGADILSPFGVLLVNKPLDKDDIDESIDLDADLNSHSDLTVPNDRVEVEDALEEEEIAHAKLSSMQKPFDRCINIEGRDILKHELYLCAVSITKRLALLIA